MRFALLAAAGVALFGQSTGVIEGRVTNSVTGEGVPGVHIRFLDRQRHVRTADTDFSGAYRLTGLDDGDYHGDFAKEGYAELDQTPFSHVASGQTTTIHAEMKPFGTLRGRVLDEDGKPAAGVQVEKEPVLPGASDPYMTTDRNGEFAFLHLEPGLYTVAAKPEPKSRMQDGVRVGAVMMYYPSATEIASASRINVRLGEQVSGIEIRLRNMPVQRITGIVLTAEGKPAARAMVTLLGPPGTARGNIGSTLVLTRPLIVRQGGVLPGLVTVVGPKAEVIRTVAMTKEDGTFAFPAVERGDWRLSANNQLDTKKVQAGVASALVADKDLENVEIRLSPPFALQVDADWGGAKAPVGFLVNEGGAVSTTPAFPQIRLTPGEGQPPVIGGNYDLNVLRMNSVFPGRYRVMPGAGPTGFYVAAVMWGGRDVNGQVVELTPGAPPFQVLYRDGFGKLNGTVDVRNAKTGGIAVFLLSRETGDVFTYRQTTGGANGAFDFGEIPPDDYYAVAFDHAGRDGLPVFEASAIVPLASSVRVEKGATASIELRLNVWPQ